MRLDETKGLFQSIKERIDREFATRQILFTCSLDVPFHGVKKNAKTIRFNRKTKKPFVTSNDRILNLQKYLVPELRSRANHIKLFEPITTDVWGLFIFRFANYYTKKGVRSLTLPDLSNLYQLPEDCLQTAGIILNDTQICCHDLSRRLPSSDDKNHLEIFLLNFNEKTD